MTATQEQVVAARQAYEAKVRDRSGYSLDVPTSDSVILFAQVQDVSSPIALSKRVVGGTQYVVSLPFLDESQPWDEYYVNPAWTLDDTFYSLYALTVTNATAGTYRVKLAMSVDLNANHAGDDITQIYVNRELLAEPDYDLWDTEPGFSEDPRPNYVYTTGAPFTGVEAETAFNTSSELWDRMVYLDRTLTIPDGYPNLTFEWLIRFVTSATFPSTADFNPLCESFTFLLEKIS